MTEDEFLDQAEGTMSYWSRKMVLDMAHGDADVADAVYTRHVRGKIQSQETLRQIRSDVNALLAAKHV